MKQLNKLLEEDMLDLNNLEQQMIQTLENENITYEDFIDRILYKKKEQLNFEKTSN